MYIVKPKLEPGKDYSPPGASADQETTPLSGGRPFFTAVMAKTHVHKPYQLVRRRRVSGHSYRQHLQGLIADRVLVFLLRPSRPTSTVGSRRGARRPCSVAVESRGSRATAATPS